MSTPTSDLGAVDITSEHGLLNSSLSVEMVQRNDSGSSKGGKYENGKMKVGNCNRAVFALIVVLLIGIGYFVNNMTYSFGGEESPMPETPSSLPKDRASAYHVRVLPATLSDADLDVLPRDSFSYLAMIDAGSSGCRVHVYRYGKLGSLEGPLYVLPNHVSKKIKPGLSSFARSPQAAGSSLQPLVDFLKEQVPEADHSTTPIWLKATAGLRMVEEKPREAILESVRAFLGSKANSPFVFRPSFARVISGAEEGGFGWISYNYLRKVIGPKQLSGADAPAPYAVVEMGGASTQVTQLARTSAEIAQVPAKHKYEFTIEGRPYVLYTHSYLGYGAEQAREGLNRYIVSNSQNKVVSPIAGSGSTGVTVKDACLNVGFDRPEGQARRDAYAGPEGQFKVSGASGATSAGGSSCYTSVQSLFQPADTVSDKCEDEGPYSFRCVYQPDFVRKAANFLVFENFYYVASAVGFDPVGAADSKVDAASRSGSDAGDGAAKAPPSPPVVFPLLTSPRQMKRTAESVCALSYADITAKYPLDSSPKEDNSKWCFGASYSAAFLVNGLHLDEDKVITVQQRVGASDVEWALGAAYKEASDFLKRTNLRPT